MHRLCPHLGCHQSWIMISSCTLSPTTRYLSLDHQTPLYLPTSKTKPSTPMQLIRMSNSAPFSQQCNELPYPSVHHSFPTFAQLLKTEMVPDSVVIFKPTLGSKHKSKDHCCIHQEDIAIVSPPNPYHPNTQVSTQVRVCALISISGTKGFLTGSHLQAASPRYPYILHKDS